MELHLRGVALSEDGISALSQILATKNINYMADPPMKGTKANSARY